MAISPSTSSNVSPPASSRASPSSRGSPPSAPPRYDGNRDPQTREISKAAKNIDGIHAFSAVKGRTVLFPPRPVQPSKVGKDVSLQLNSFNVTAYPSKPVYQYDVLIDNGTEKRGLIKAIWQSGAVKDGLNGARGWIFDGNQLAWSLDNNDRELRIIVDMDKEKGRESKAGREDRHRVIIKKSKTLTFDVLRGYISGTNDWDDRCLEAITFLDHLLRETSSQKYISIKRNFFARTERRNVLAPGLEHMFGVYQSMRLCHQPGTKGTGLTVNVDVANGTFWSAGPLIQVISNLFGGRGEADVVAKLRQTRQDTNARDDPYDKLKHLAKLRVTTTHRKQGDAQDHYTIKKFLRKDANEYTFKAKMPDGKEKQISIANYFAQKYNYRLRSPNFPVVETGKGAVLPVECLTLDPDQRYVNKLDERATAAMIKLAVTPPRTRWAAVDHGLKMLSWQTDTYLHNYGMRIDPAPVNAKGRLLPPPEVAFANGTVKPLYSGRWDVRGKKFLVPNTQPLKSWGVCVIPARGRQPDKNAIQHCINELVKIYTGHGGRIETKQPVMHLAGEDPGRAVEEIYQKTGNQFKLIPQLLVFILPDRTATTYGRIKKSAECRYGVVTQCMQYSNVQKAQGQYLSNVCLKMNAKLGGATARSISAQSKGPTGLFKVPTMVMGVDISHGPPGILSPSMAAVTCSSDPLCTRYNALVNTNGYRMEQLSTDNIRRLVKPLIQQWMQKAGNGKFPQRIIYMRDGCSEGQFSMVINQEVEDIKQLIRSVNTSNPLAFTVLVATKRHHIRFFPKDNNKDKNENPLPGTLLETGVTHPKMFNFFLNSHAAIKGTSRPTHYHVLLNESTPNSPAMSPDQIHQLCYEHVYQYCRSTTPVSLPPAIYYAHLASKRAVFHDPDYPNKTGSNEKQTSSQGGSQNQTTSSDPANVDFKDLMPMKANAGNRIQDTMWWV